MSVIRLFEFLLIFSEDSFLLTNAKIISKKSRLFDRDLLAYFSFLMMVIWWYVLISISVCALNCSLIILSFFSLFVTLLG